MRVGLVDALTALVDLVLPANCAGCDARSTGVLCAACAAEVAAAAPHRVRPTPEPDGLPATVALAAYGGAFSAAIVGYKDRGRRGLAKPLGDRLADAVRACVGGSAPPGVVWTEETHRRSRRVDSREDDASGGGARTSAASSFGTARPVLLVPVPATAAAVRERHGDHMTGLARRAAQALRRSGWAAAVAHPLRALPRPDSAHLSASARAAAAVSAFTTHPARVPPVRRAVAAGVTVVLVDDVMTTGSTLCAVARALERASVPVRHAAVLAATRRGRHVPGTTRDVSYRS